MEPEEREDTSEERPRYLAVTEPAIPSQEILSQMSVLLLRIVTLPEGDDWVELAVNLIRGSDWEFQVEARLSDRTLFYKLGEDVNGPNLSAGALIW